MLKLCLLVPLVVLAFQVDISSACGSSTDAEYIANPVFSMQISPPVGWTYFPATPSVANQAIWYFVGQSNDTSTAKNRADAELTAAMLEALVAANVQTQGVTIANDFQPIQVENPQTTTPTGSLYGKVEGGALVATAPGVTTGAILSYTPYHVTMRVTVSNVGATRFYWNIVQSTFLQKMSMNYKAQFVGDVTVTKV
ncbi:Protein CBG03287 [Caenorhabditis briggsae]|uniref:DUF1795 domain-containing protein n=2 Tax=Caenorhabditis briggsae TaxID=6238 RepID=A0AAE9DK77_CAEBR|nr:Protein CBG03287 [Caenorhabditis briggsae]ULU05498.1 hypothetical protein L3Y34_017870 [Caenorhabditis briggsae]UMM17463.1 hypothetical protein L5515_013998 [Caenorhabditis briggsae]CAP23394.1 Protein CBG03287 [Caenorhabditis briggsae]